RDWGMALSLTGKSAYLLVSAASEALAADVGSIGFKCADDKILQDCLPFRVSEGSGGFEAAPRSNR
ncbi:hypothetical protein NKJ90_29035, partial [Mesorhizobium sp. M0051]|uniref:hypothetical protein n=1 Tax=Mesorhizobium sp. M0051 TaxID=2956862 RepID=UPI0033374A5B